MGRAAHVGPSDKWDCMRQVIWDISDVRYH